MLPLLAFFSNVQGGLYLNHQFVGETDLKEYITFFFGNNKDLYLEFKPFNTGGNIYSSIYCKLRIQGDSIIYDSDYICGVKYKDNTFIIEINSKQLSLHTIPYCAAHMTLAGRFLASIMYHNGFFLIIEDNKQIVEDKFFTLDFCEGDIHLDTFNIQGNTGFIFSDNANRVYVMKRDEQDFEQDFILLLECDANSYTALDGELLISKETSFHHKIINRYTFLENELFLVETNYVVSYDCVYMDDYNLVKDFLECLMYGIEEGCFKLLSEDFKQDLDFKDIKDFVGDFYEFKISPFEKDVFMLKNKDSSQKIHIKTFAFSIIEGIINNIEEL